MNPKAHKSCVEGTPPEWQRLMTSCRYCGSCGSPKFTGCLECPAYIEYFKENKENAAPNAAQLEAVKNAMALEEYETRLDGGLVSDALRSGQDGKAAEPQYCPRCGNPECVGTAFCESGALEDDDLDINLDINLDMKEYGERDE